MPADHNEKGKKVKKQVPGKDGKEEGVPGYVPVIVPGYGTGKMATFDEPITIRITTQPGVKLAQHTCFVNFDEETDMLTMITNGCIQCEQHGGWKIEHVNQAGVVVKTKQYP